MGTPDAPIAGEAERRFRLSFVHSPIPMASWAVDGSFTSVNQAYCLMVGRCADELAGGMRWHDVTHPDDVAAQAAELARALREGADSFEVRKRFLHTAGHTVITRLVVTVLPGTEPDAPPSFFAQVEDVTERTREQQHREAASEVALAVLEGQDMGDLLGLVTQHARRVLHADAAVVAVPASPGPLRIVAADGSTAAIGEQLDLGPVGPRLLSEGNAIALPEVGAQRSPVTARMLGSGPAALARLALPDGGVGVVAVARSAGSCAFGTDDIATVEWFANQAAVALGYVAMRQGLEHLAVLQDRERIAMDLHDGIIQSLFAVGLGLQSAQSRVEEPVAMKETLSRAIDGVDRVISDIRGYIFGLRHEAQVSEELEAALRDLATELEGRSGVVAAVEVYGTVDLGAVGADVVQVCREALSNVARHAHATTCRVTLRALPGGAGCVLEVDDDGCGFDVSHALGAGDGLSNAGRRAELVGGTFEVVSASGEGTLVRLTVPATRRCP